MQFERSIGNGTGNGSAADLKQCRAILKRGVSLLSTAAANIQQQQQQQSQSASASASASGFASASVESGDGQSCDEGDSQLTRLCRAWVALERQTGDTATLAEANQRCADKLLFDSCSLAVRSLIFFFAFRAALSTCICVCSVRSYPCAMIFMCRFLYDVSYRVFQRAFEYAYRFITDDMRTISCQMYLSFFLPISFYLFLNLSSSRSLSLCTSIFPFFFIHTVAPSSSRRPTNASPPPPPNNARPPPRSLKARARVTDERRGNHSTQ